MTDSILAEELAKQLRRDILRGRFAPGTPLKERDNAAELGVSRTPMREAIRFLAKEGLIELRPSRSPIVKVLDPDEVLEQAQVLVALEKLGAELACENATESDLRAIRSIVARMDAEFDTVDPLDMFEIDMSFHTAIAQASHNRALAETHRSFLQRLWHARYLAAVQRRARERVVTEHTRILDALEARDPVAARSAIDKHLWRLGDDIKAEIARRSEQNDTIKPLGRH